ncbi:MAG: chemotaxis protein [Candidatus Magnetoovum sp. WYHC-5]|nr:chemotaxis protein [Candidatus Magnetoovum sp. WYHC-5]
MVNTPKQSTYRSTYDNGQKKGNQMEMLTFFLTDNQLYAINVFKIIEILECPSKITTLPHAHPSIKGTINFRGKSISIIDVAEFLKLDVLDYKNKLCYVIVCEYHKMVQGFLISAPDTLLSRGWEDIKKPGDMVSSCAYLTAVTHSEDGKMIQILDIEKMIIEIIGVSEELAEEYIEMSKDERYKKHHILLVDDSKAARTMMKTVLDKMGVTFTLMDSAVGALQLMEDLSESGDNIPKMFSMVISDIEMPVMDGYTFCRKIKSNAKLSNLYVMLHSSLSDKASIVKAEQSGSDDFTPKFDPNVIAVKIMRRIDELEKKRS